MNFLNKYYYSDLSKIVSKYTQKSKTILVLSDQEKLKDIKKVSKYKFIVYKNNIAYIKDLQSDLTQLSKYMNYSSKLILIYYNHLWEPALRFASYFGLSKYNDKQNWLDEDDIKNILKLSGFEIVTSSRRVIFPIEIPLISNFLNKYIALFPLINLLCLTTITTAKPSKIKMKNYSVSIVVPARNEAGNINKIVNSIPKFGKKIEIIFVEGNSDDNTWDEILKVSKLKYKNGISVKCYKQKGKGKADAVRLGFKKASGDIFMIYDADMTVDAKDLPKFYDVLATGYGEFVNGSRLVYPMEKDAMRTLNKIGNKIFSLAFTWILGQRFKDTLCGTKVLFRKDYEEIVKHRKKYGSVDPFGDFDLIFGAIRQNLKVVEIPVRYKERIYGSTNISRFKHGLLLLKMTIVAFKEFKAW